MTAGQDSWSSTGYLESGTISTGQVGCLNAAGTKYIVASAANRTAAGRRSACIACSDADADSNDGSGFQAKHVGVVPPSITGLGAGSASSIRVSSAGRLERAAFDAADDVVGRCDADGTAYVCFPLIGLNAAFGTVGAALPTNSVQASNADGSFRGATHASISSDGYAEFRSKTAGTQPTVGTIRGDDGGLDDAEAWSIATRMQDATTMRPLWSYSASGSPYGASNWRYLQQGDGGAATFHGAVTFAHYVWQASVRGIGTDDPSNVVLQYIPGTSPSAGLTGRRWFALSTYTNLFMCGDNDTPANPEDALCGGESVIALGVAKVDPTTASAAGFTCVWVRRADRHLMQRIGSTDYDLTASGGSDRPVKIVSTDGALGTISLLVGGVVAETVIFTGTNSADLDGFTPTPAAGTARRLTIINHLTAESATLTIHDTTAGVAAESFYLPGGSNVVLPAGQRGYGVVYDEHNPGWVLEYAP